LQGHHAHKLARIRRPQILAGLLLCAVLTFGAYTLGGSALAGEAAVRDPDVVHSLADVPGATLYFQAYGNPIPLAPTDAVARMDGSVSAQLLESQADLDGLLAVYGVDTPVSLGSAFFSNHAVVAVAVRGAGSSPCRAVAMQLADHRLTAVVAPGFSSGAGDAGGQLLLLTLAAQDLPAKVSTAALLLEA